MGDRGARGPRLASGRCWWRAELSRAAPLLPVDLMRIPLFALSVTTSICAFTAQSMALVSLPFLFENTLGLGQVRTGLLMTPWPLVVAVIAPFTGRLADRYPGRHPERGGADRAGRPGSVAGRLLPAHPGSFDIVWRMVICGLGFGFFNTPNNRAIVASAPRQRTAGRRAMQAAGRLFGQTTGAALVALVFHFDPSTATRDCIFVAAGFAAAGALISTARLRATAPAPSQMQTTPPGGLRAGLSRGLRRGRPSRRETEPRSRAPDDRACGGRTRPGRGLSPFSP